MEEELFCSLYYLFFSAILWTFKSCSDLQLSSSTAVKKWEHKESVLKIRISHLNLAPLMAIMVILGMGILGNFGESPTLVKIFPAYGCSTAASCTGYVSTSSFEIDWLWWANGSFVKSSTNFHFDLTKNRLWIPKNTYSQDVLIHKGQLALDR